MCFFYSVIMIAGIRFKKWLHLFEWTSFFDKVYFVWSIWQICEVNIVWTLGLISHLTELYFLLITFIFYCLPMQNYINWGYACMNALFVPLHCVGFFGVPRMRLLCHLISLSLATGPVAWYKQVTRVHGVATSPLLAREVTTSHLRIIPHLPL